MRTDAHRPAEIIPSEYEFVGIWTMNIVGMSDVYIVLSERETIRNHMARTGGTYAKVETSGECQICGNVNAIYLELFYHAKSNSYIRVGIDCGRKLGMSGDDNRMNIFRKQLDDVRRARAGKAKTYALLSDKGLMRAWDIMLAIQTEREERQKAFTAAVQENQPEPNFERFPYEETTIEDIVSKVIRYGNLSDKAADYIKVLIEKIDNRPLLAAKRAEENANAEGVPAGRVIITGRVVGKRAQEVRSYSWRGGEETITKVLIQDLRGFKIWGTQFARIEKGDLITFTASVEVSEKDSKFGFFKRAAKIHSVDEKSGELLDEWTGYEWKKEAAEREAETIKSAAERDGIQF